MANICALINKNTLSYICQGKGVSYDFLSNKIKTKTLKQWLDPNDNTVFPTIKQAKKLASCLHVPFAGLYMNPDDIPLKEIPNLRNMRKMPEVDASDDSSINIAIIDVLLERDFLLDANSELGQVTKGFVPIVPKETNPVIWADAIRKQFSISLERQFSCRSTRQFYLYLRDKIEAGGVFIHCFTDVPLEDARGFAVYYSTLPVIGINDKDRPPAKTFSIIHELVHLFKRESSLCNDMQSMGVNIGEEVFCNSVAGELLVPKKVINAVLENEHYSAPYSAEIVKKIACQFSVSREVVIRRLYDLNLINKYEYGIYADLFKREVENEREQQKADRNADKGERFPRNISLEAIDRTSPSVSKALYHGYMEEVYSKQDIARHLNIDQKHINKFLMEIAKWNS